MKFEVNENRDEISLNTAQQRSGLSDLVVDNEDELSAITFGSGFGGITDIETVWTALCMYCPMMTALFMRFHQAAQFNSSNNNTAI